jgi:hypothetical protein
MDQVRWRLPVPDMVVIAMINVGVSRPMPAKNHERSAAAAALMAGMSQAPETPTERESHRNSPPQGD